jgi:hypothetical protein
MANCLMKGDPICTAEPKRVFNGGAFLGARFLVCGE